MQRALSGDLVREALLAVDERLQRQIGAHHQVLRPEEEEQRPQGIPCQPLLAPAFHVVPCFLRTRSASTQAALRRLRDFFTSCLGVIDLVHMSRRNHDMLEVDLCCCCTWLPWSLSLFGIWQLFWLQFSMYSVMLAPSINVQNPVAMAVAVCVLSFIPLFTSACRCHDCEFVRLYSSRCLSLLANLRLWCIAALVLLVAHFVIMVLAVIGFTARSVTGKILSSMTLC